MMEWDDMNAKGGHSVMALRRIWKVLVCLGEMQGFATSAGRKRCVYKSNFSRTFSDDFRRRFSHNPWNHSDPVYPANAAIIRNIQHFPNWTSAKILRLHAFAAVPLAKNFPGWTTKFRMISRISKKDFKFQQLSSIKLIARSCRYPEKLMGQPANSGLPQKRLLIWHPSVYKSCKWR